MPRPKRSASIIWPIPDVVLDLKLGGLMHGQRVKRYAIGWKLHRMQRSIRHVPWSTLDVWRPTHFLIGHA